MLVLLREDPLKFMGEVEELPELTMNASTSEVPELSFVDFWPKESPGCI